MLQPPGWTGTSPPPSPSAAGQEDESGQEAADSPSGLESGSEEEAPALERPVEGELASEEEYLLREEGNTMMHFTARWMLDGCGSFEEMRHVIGWAPSKLAIVGTRRPACACLTHELHLQL